MLSPIASSIVSLLKLLTPKEVSRISKSNGSIEETAQVGETAVGSIQIGFEGAGNINANDSGKNAKAELIPIEENEESDPYKNVTPINAQGEHQESNHRDTSSRPSFVDVTSNDILDDDEEDTINEDSDLEKAGILSASKLERQRQKKLLEKKKREPSSSMFLLAEREKLKNNRIKSVYKSAINNYENQKNNDNSGSADSSVGSTGVLVDKKLA